MREETKAAIRLAMKRWFLRQARNIVWRADEWIHKHEQQLHGISIPFCMESAGTARPERSTMQSAGAQPDHEQLSNRISRRTARLHQQECPAPPEIDREPFPQMALLADEIGAESDSPRITDQRRLRANAGCAAKPTRIPAGPTWTEIKTENNARRQDRRRPLWMALNE